jgi:hypothetical protein
LKGWEEGELTIISEENTPVILEILSDREIGHRGDSESLG